jgi:small nuclear ribonucleoprotein (snRNP)-like protein
MPKVSVKKDFYELLRGKRVVIQCRGKAVRYEGVLCGFDNGYIILSNAVIYGTQHIAHTDLLGVDRSVVQHIHLDPVKVEMLKKGEKGV